MVRFPAGQTRGLVKNSGEVTINVLDINTTRQGRRCIMEVAGSIDLASQDSFVRALDQAVGQHDVHEVSLDLRRLDFMGSAGVSAILKARSALSERRGALGVVGCSPRAARVMRLLRAEFLLAAVAN